MGFRSTPRPQSVFLFTVLFVLCFFLTGSNKSAFAQEASLTGEWKGSLSIGRDTTGMAFTISLTDGKYTATYTNTDHGIYGMPVDSITIKDKNVIIKLNRLDVEFFGSFQFNSSNTPYELFGDWFQESELTPLVLKRDPSQ